MTEDALGITLELTFQSTESPEDMFTETTLSKQTPAPEKIIHLDHLIEMHPIRGAQYGRVHSPHLARNFCFSPLEIFLLVNSFVFSISRLEKFFIRVNLGSFDLDVI
jgi:hypothetical protein